MANTRRPTPSELQRQRNQNTTKKPPNPLITAAEYFLSLRSFTETITYATRAQLSDPTHPSPSRLISIAKVLSTRPVSETRPDYYSVLNLSAFETDIVKIKDGFKSLTCELNPNVNTFPFSNEAFDLVLKAWAVLSDPVEKLKFDNELTVSICNVDNGSDDVDDGNESFWTVCPYCYYVFEYEKVYENCCLRCSNEGCKRAFSSVAIGRPPKEVIEVGRYKCLGFMPVSGSEWVPSVNASVDVLNGVGKGGDCEDGFVIDVSDDENEIEGNGSGKRSKTGGENEVEGNGMKTGGEDGSKFIVDGVEMDWSECLNIIGGESGESGIEFYEGKDDLFVGLDGLVD